VNITPKEKALLAKIRECDLHDGRNPIDNWVYTNYDVNTHSDAGVLGSLITKELVHHNGCTGEDSCVALTRTGFQASLDRPTLDLLRLVLKCHEVCVFTEQDRARARVLFRADLITLNDDWLGLI